jgi:hypothetical protein
MARSRTPRPKADPITYAIDDELTAVATKIMARHEVHFADLRQLRIAFVMVTGGRQPNSTKIDGVWARFMKAPPIWHALTNYDAIVWVRAAVWRHLSAEQREALVAHQLSHGVVTEKGALTVARHDLEDFAWVARNYGAWNEGVELFGKQLSLFGTKDAAPSSKKPASDDAAFADLDERQAQRKAERAAASGKPTSEATEPTPIRRRRASSASSAATPPA